LAHFDATDVHGVVGIHYRDLVDPLKFANCALRHPKSPLLGIHKRAYLPKLPGSQQIFGIGKEDGDS
jgi:hypothetical protein